MLEEAYQEGWEGFSDLKESVAERILRDNIEESEYLTTVDSEALVSQASENAGMPLQWTVSSNFDDGDVLQINDTNGINIESTIIQPIGSEPYYIRTT